jgi:hypothetical protein
MLLFSIWTAKPITAAKSRDRAKNVQYLTYSVYDPLSITATVESVGHVSLHLVTARTWFIKMAFVFRKNISGETTVVMRPYAYGESDSDISKLRIKFHQVQQCF